MYPHIKEHPVYIRNTFKYLLLFSVFALIGRLTIFVRQRSGEQFAQVDALAVIQMFLIVFTCFLLLLCPLRKSALKSMRGMAAYSFVWFYLVAIASAVWSPMPEFTMFRGVEALSQYVAVFVAIYYCRDFIQAEKWFLGTAALCILMMAGAQIKFGGFALSLGGWHTNTYSAAAAILFCYCMGEYFTNKGPFRRYLLFFGLFALFFLAIGTSSASNISALFGVILVGLLSKNLKLVWVAIMLVLLGFSFLNESSLYALLFPGKSAEALESMTGRTQLWEMYFEDLAANFIFGKGFAVTARIAERYTTNMHNGFLGALFGLGAVGCVFLVAGLKRLVVEWFRAFRWRVPGAVGCIAGISAGLANNTTFSLFGEQWNPSLFAFVCLLALHTYFVVPRKSW